MAGGRFNDRWLSLLLTSLVLVSGGQERRTDRNVAAAAFDRLPVSFELNAGQTDPAVLFSFRGPKSTLLLTQTHAVFALNANERGDAVQMGFVGANPHSRIEGIDRQAGQVHYFIGRDPAKWRTNVPTYAKVRYEGIYPGIDLVFHGDNQRLEYDFVVAPGGDPANIAISFAGKDSMHLDGNGDLILELAGGALHQPRPFIYQLVSGQRRQIDGRFVVVDDDPKPPSHRVVRFEIAPYDRSRPLVIDPVLIYSTYFGGSGADRGVQIEVDETGAYLFGQTTSLDFPATAGSSQPRPGGAFDAFVTKLSLDGTTVLYSTYFGGSGNEDPFVATGFAVDRYGSVIFGSRTNSTDLPVVGAFQPAYGGGTTDGFIAKLSPSGSTLLYSSYIGGSDADQLEMLAVDDDGHAYASGSTRSLDFPTKHAFQSTYGGGTWDAFVAKVRVRGELDYSTFLGGSGQDDFAAIAVDAGGGEAHVSGRTSSPDFPTIAALQPTNAGGPFDVFVTKFARDGRSLIYSTYLGGSGNDQNRNILVNAERETHVVGVTASPNFPIVRAIQSSNAGGAFDAFVLKLPSDGSRLIYSTYFGGSGDDRIIGLAEDRSGDLVFDGLTNSMDLPTVNPLQRTFAGGLFDGVVGQITRHGEALLFSTYLGGSGEDRSLDVDVDARDNVYAIGLTDSTNFPTLNALQPRNAGSFDAWLAKITP